jgi:hypothetical protein
MRPLSLFVSQLLSTSIDDTFPLSKSLINVSLRKNGILNSMTKHPATRPCDHRHQAVSLVTLSQLNLPKTDVPSSWTRPTIPWSSPRVSRQGISGQIVLIRKFSVTTIPYRSITVSDVSSTPLVQIYLLFPYSIYILFLLSNDTSLTNQLLVPYTFSLVYSSD